LLQPTCYELVLVAGEMLQEIGEVVLGRFQPHRRGGDLNGSGRAGDGQGLSVDAFHLPAQMSAPGWILERPQRRIVRDCMDVPAHDIQAAGQQVVDRPVDLGSALEADEDSGLIKRPVAAYLKAVLRVDM
jgi:hypothetical protein